MGEDKVPFTLTTKRKLTLPVVKFDKDVPKFLKITGALHLGKQLKGTGDKSKMEPATLADVVDLETGEAKQMICSAIIKSVLAENYPDDSYVGLCFQVTKHNKREGKGYYDYSIDEVSDPSVSSASVKAPVAGTARR